MEIVQASFEVLRAGFAIISSESVCLLEPRTSDGVCLRFFRFCRNPDLNLVATYQYLARKKKQRSTEKYQHQYLENPARGEDQYQNQFNLDDQQVTQAFFRLP